MAFTFRKGMKNLGTRLEKHKYYLADCRNCVSYLPKEDGCSNINVTEFDFCVEGGKKYCPFWTSFVNENGGK